MTGPINTFDVTPTGGLKKVWRKSETQPFGDPWDSPLQIHAQRRPALVINPKRPDGTRRMSSWNNRWFKSATPGATFGIVANATAPASTRQTLYTGTSLLSKLPDRQPSAGQYGTYWEIVENLLPWSPSLEVTSDQVARTKVLNKLSQKKWDLGVTALEMKQTAGLVTDLAQSLVGQVEGLINSRKNMRRKLNDFFRDVRRQGSFDKAAVNVGLSDTNLLNDLRSKWMQYQFGIKPALMDVDNAVNFLSDALHQHGLSVLVAARAGHESKDTGWVEQLGRYNGICTADLQYEETCVTHYSVVYELPTGHVSAVNALGLDNPYNIAWEVSRLSWMVDYVVGVGDWLQSFTAANGMIFREGSRSTLRRVSGSQVRVNSLNVNRNLTFVPPRSTGVWVDKGHFRRELLTHGVVPAFVPQIKSELGLVQLANSLFAMSSVLGGKPGLR